MREGSALATILLVAVIAAGAATLVTASWELGKDRIAANQRARLLEDLYSVLDPDLVGEDLVPVSISVLDKALLGSTDPIEVFIPMRDRQPVAAIFASIAPNGYNAPIHLLVGISAQTNSISGVRAISHRETPGLGDLIESRKSNWILQFNGTSSDSPTAADWRLKKDDGAFDSITGATVTPRAVVAAVHNTLLFFDAHKEELFESALAAIDTGGRGVNE
jgi:electron transport complex protein RnfG